MGPFVMEQKFFFQNRHLTFVALCILVFGTFACQPRVSSDPRGNEIPGTDAANTPEPLIEDSPSRPMSDAVNGNIPLPFILAGGILAEIPFLYLAWRLMKKGRITIGYLAGLPPIFYTWYLAEKQVLSRCIACFAFHGIQADIELCCDAGSIALMPYTWLLLGVNALYLFAVGAVMVKCVKQVPASSMDGKAEAFRRIGIAAKSLFIHGFFVASAFWTAAAFHAYITYYKFRDWRQAEGPLCAGIVSTAIAFFILWMFLTSVRKEMAILHAGGIKENRGTFVLLVIFLVFILCLSLFCWATSYSLFFL